MNYLRILIKLFLPDFFKTIRMKKKLLKIGFAILFTIHFSGFSQEKELIKAEENYNVYAFAKAIDIYEKLAEKGYGSVDVYKNLGNSYYFNADLINAGKWYKKLFELTKDVESEYYFRYSHSLKALGDYENADKMMLEFEKLASDGRGKLYNNTRDYLDLIKLQSNRYETQNLAFNSTQSDFAPSFHKGKLVFSSARDTGTFVKNKHKWNNKYFLDLYTGVISEDGRIKDVEGLSKSINTKFHESTSVFTSDGKTIYFTRNNYSNGNKGKDDEGITKLKIYKASMNSNGKWSNIMELPFNSNNYSVAHPALSIDEKRLYFASDMPGTIGLSDIFYVDIHPDGTYGEPVNLGSNVNTEARETFPFISLNNNLYFSSDGRPGLGGLDVYFSKLDDNNLATNDIYNLGKPVNSPSDDFTFVIDDETGLGYFASNREGGMGDDDIYLINIKPDCKEPVKGIIKDKNTKEPLANAEVSYVNTENVIVSTIITNDNGEFNFMVDCEKINFIRAAKKEYSTNEVKIDTIKSAMNIELQLERDLVEAVVGSDLALILDLKPIYFDFDKWAIREDAKVEFEKVIAALKKYPSIKIDVRSHTDSRSSDAYNMQLSERRAKATVQYIISQGIDESRVTGKGYGETQPINECTNGVNCTREQHQLNRRSEFIISK